MRKDRTPQVAEAPGEKSTVRSNSGSSATSRAGKGPPAKRLQPDAGEASPGAGQSPLDDPRVTRQQGLGFFDGREGKLQLHSAIGFAVAPGGYILTTASAVRDPDAIVVRILNCDELPAARVTAADKEHDMALIRIRVPDGATLEPLALSSQAEMESGDAIATFRSSSTEAQGDNLKMALGLITAPAENIFGPFQFDVTDSSPGSPVCDAHGNVIGMTTTPGSALRAGDLSRFLRDHIEGFRPIADHSVKKEWVDIEKTTRASVVLVLGHK
jgi:S1-C subfamily serine protease